MEERAGQITMKGNPLTLIGKAPKVGDTAPDFEALDNNLSPVRLSAFKGKTCVISSVPSLDTPVCDMETRRFNQEAGSLGDCGSGVDHQHGPALRAKTMVRCGGRRASDDPVGPQGRGLRCGLRGA